MVVTVRQLQNPTLEKLGEDYSAIDLSGGSWIFDSWVWIHYWWSHFGRKSSLCVIEVEDLQTKGRNLAFMHRHWALLRGVLPIRRLEFIGNHWNMEKSCPSEYKWLPCFWDIDLKAEEAFWSYVFKMPGWDELVLCNFHYSAMQLANLKTLCRQHGFTFVTVDEGNSYFIDRSLSWEEYLISLPASTRRKMFNHREKMQGRLTHSVVGIDRIGETLNCLDGLIDKRFGRISGTKKINAFFRGLCHEFAKRGSLRLTTLSIDRQVASVMLCLLYGNDVFFFRLGINAKVEKSISVGLLHLGFEIEQSLDAKRGKFWLLSGTGKERQYKAKIGSPEPCVSVRIVRNRLLRSYWKRVRNVSEGGI